MPYNLFSASINTLRPRELVLTSQLLSGKIKCQSSVRDYPDVNLIMDDTPGFCPTNPETIGFHVERRVSG